MPYLVSMRGYIFGYDEDGVLRYVHDVSIDYSHDDYEWVKTFYDAIARRLKSMENVKIEEDKNKLVVKTSSRLLPEGFGLVNIGSVEVYDIEVELSLRYINPIMEW